MRQRFYSTVCTYSTDSPIIAPTKINCTVQYSIIIRLLLSDRMYCTYVLHSRSAIATY